MFLQIFLWVLGGVVFATIPFKPLVKGDAFVVPPAPINLPLGWQANLAELSVQARSVSARDSAQGPLIRVDIAGEALWFYGDGRAVGVADSSRVATFASKLYRGTGVLQEVRWLENSETQMLGLVDEMSGQGNVWQATFDDARLYFGAQGQYLKVRTDYWVWYDALWRLHIMDYGEGENFNNNLLRFFAWFSFVFVMSGLVLSFYAFRRTARQLSSIG